MLGSDLVCHRREVKPETNDNLVDAELYNLITQQTYGTKYSFNLVKLLPNGWVKNQSHVEEHSVFVVKGKGKILLGDEWFDLEEGDYIFIPSHTIHSFKNSEKAPMEILILKI